MTVTHRGTLTILMQGDKPGSIALMPDDLFRWDAQKILWQSYKTVGEAIGVDVRGRLTKSDLNQNSTRIDDAKRRLTEKFAAMGFEYKSHGYSPACGMLRQLCGARLEGYWPKSKEECLTYIRRTIENSQVAIFWRELSQ